MFFFARASYVVDLIEFRRRAVGDQLRAIYDQLSRDPNSLANLDQDLPNYAQHQVPIFSLPQEWLWCESWCSDGSKEASKTIDLCNNPLHKEPKLDMARRVISGELFHESWVELDAEAQALQQGKGVPEQVEAPAAPEADAAAVDAPAEGAKVEEPKEEAATTEDEKPKKKTKKKRKKKKKGGKKRKKKKAKKKEEL